MPNAQIFHWKFDQTTNEVEDLEGGYDAYMGSTDDFVDPYDENDPYIVYRNGLYFDGVDIYCQLPPNPVDTDPIIFGNSHSFSIWINPQFQNKDHYIITKED